MAENENDTSATSDGTQEAEGSGNAPDPKATASQEGDTDVSVLRSRFAGQTAKVNELTSQKAALEAKLQELQKQLGDAQKGVTTADDAAKALIAAKDQELAAARQELALSRIEAKYPEVFRELGADAASLSDEKLAAMEARFQGTAEEDKEPTPRGNNAAKSGSATKGTGGEAKGESSADILAQMRTMGVPSEWGGQG